jgi:hypothetical protein
MLPGRRMWADLCCAIDSPVKPSARRDIRTRDSRYRRAQPIPTQEPFGHPRCLHRSRRVSFLANPSSASSRPLLLFCRVWTALSAGVQSGT